MRKKKTKLLGIRYLWLFSLAALMLPAGCAGSSAARQDGGTDLAVTPAGPSADSGTALPVLLAAALPAPARLVSTGSFPPSQLGQDYLASGGAGRCTVTGTAAVLAPAWVAGEQSGFDDLAYGIYGLGLPTGAISAVLSLSWAAAGPAAGLGWLGLSDWGGASWEWHALTGSELSLPAAQQYADSGGNLLAAVVLLGTAPGTLNSIALATAPQPLSYPIVDTMQDACYDDHGQVIDPQPGQPFDGQDAQYLGNQASYTDNGDGTITDNITGLMWAKSPNNMQKTTFSAAFTVADDLTLAGYDDWRVPTIKELYSLIDFRGATGMSAAESEPYIDTNYFDFAYGNEAAGERFIDAQYWSSTEYVSTTMNGSPTTFGVNFADGRIKGYGRVNPQSGEMEQFLRCVRGGTAYGINDLMDNGDGTITDRATGLTWMQFDSGYFNAGPRGDGTLNWQEALAWAAGQDYAGHDDWRLPNAKELESIVDYTRSPDTTGSAAIDPLFHCTSITDEGGDPDYAFYWTSTTHRDGPVATRGDYACYVAFGEAHGWMEVPPASGNYFLWDVHGAGCQRSDPKDGDPADYPYGHGPQGDVVRIFNLVRLVRGNGNNP